MSTSRTLAIMVTLVALAVCCGGTGIGHVDGGGGGGGGTGVHPSGHVSTPTAHFPTDPPACTPRGPQNCPATGLPGCKLDSECTAGLNGRCAISSLGGACACEYDACAT